MWICLTMTLCLLQEQTSKHSPNVTYQRSTTNIQVCLKWYHLHRDKELLVVSHCSVEETFTHPVILFYELQSAKHGALQICLWYGKQQQHENKHPVVFSVSSFFLFLCGILRRNNKRQQNVIKSRPDGRIQIVT